jgi:uncharacterized protein (DUF433 family)
MSQAAVEYAYKTPEGGWRIADSRVSLDSVVYAFHEGLSAEEIALEFPTLTLIQVYGAIAFYLRNQREIDTYLSGQDTKCKDEAEINASQHASLLNRLRKRRPPDGKE